jgi:SAM-dependent methyltransferase
MTIPSDAESGRQRSIDTRNVDFWNALCGSWAAQAIGVTDDSSESLRRFDEWILAFYPYLVAQIPFEELRGRRVLEVGLGYGTVAQRIAESGANYTGLDIAPGPVEMVNHRMRIHGLSGRAQRGSILNAPFSEASFDCVVAIGCYHHTGNMQRAFDESYRLLRPSGLLIAMVYNAYSYRRWLNAFAQTARYLWWDLFRLGQVPLVDTAERAAYDADTAGNAAPYTEFVSRRQLRRICRQFSWCRTVLRNIDQERPFSGRPREELLRTCWPSLCGLDIYLQACK